MGNNLDQIPHIFWTVLAVIALTGIAAVYCVIIKPHYDRQVEEIRERFRD